MALRGDNGVRQTEIRKLQPLGRRSSTFEVYMDLEKLKNISPFIDPTPANQIQVRSSEIHKLTNSVSKKKELLQQ